jgi:hypothetical protein
VGATRSWQTRSIEGQARVRRVDEIAPRLERLSFVHLPGRTGVEVTLNRRVDRADIDDAMASVTSVLERVSSLGASGPSEAKKSVGTLA